MINVKTEILEALEANQVLFSLLGNKKSIYQLGNDEAIYPKITFFELNNSDDGFADNTAVSSEVFVQIDIWSKGSTTKIAQEVDKTMKQLMYQRTSSADLFENDTKIFHKAMRYITTKFY